MKPETSTNTADANRVGSTGGSAWLRVNYGINRRKGKGIEHANGKMRIKGSLEDTRLTPRFAASSHAVIPHGSPRDGVSLRRTSRYDFLKLSQDESELAQAINHERKIHQERKGR